MRVFVVTGTDTEVGKTVVTAALSRLALDRGRSVAVVKPTQTGIAGTEPTDIATVGRLSGAERLSELVRLDDPLAPDTAARRTGTTIPGWASWPPAPSTSRTAATCCSSRAPVA